MALVKESKVDKIEVVGEHKIVQVRVANVILDDGVEIARQHHRHVVVPGQDVSDEEQQVKDIVAVVHTPDVVQAYINYLAEVQNGNV